MANEQGYIYWYICYSARWALSFSGMDSKWQSNSALYGWKRYGVMYVYTYVYVYICVTARSPGKFLLHLPTTILYAMVCVLLTRLNRLSWLSGIGCHDCARIYFKGAGCSTTIGCAVCSCAGIAGTVATIDCHK